MQLDHFYKPIFIFFIYRENYFELRKPIAGQYFCSFARARRVFRSSRPIANFMYSPRCMATCSFFALYCYPASRRWYIYFTTAKSTFGMGPPRALIIKWQISEAACARASASGEDGRRTESETWIWCRAEGWMGCAVAQALWIAKGVREQEGSEGKEGSCTPDSAGSDMLAGGWLLLGAFLHSPSWHRGSPGQRRRSLFKRVAGTPAFDKSEREPRDIWAWRYRDEKAMQSVRQLSRRGGL